MTPKIPREEEQTRQEEEEGEGEGEVLKRFHRADLLPVKPFLRETGHQVSAIELNPLACSTHAATAFLAEVRAQGLLQVILLLPL